MFNKELTNWGLMFFSVPWLKLFKPVVFVMALLPMALLVDGAINNTLGANPTETMTRTTGDWALYFLLITLSITPLRQLLGQGWLIRYRRMLGLFVYFYACLHLLTYVWFDQFFNVSEIAKDIVKRPFITIGFLMFLLLTPLALTSTKGMVRRLKQKWQKLHQLIYLISMLAVLHYFMMTRADYKQPLILALILSFLLGYRFWKRTFRVKNP